MVDHIQEHKILKNLKDKTIRLAFVLLLAVSPLIMQNPLQSSYSQDAVTNNSTANGIASSVDGVQKNDTQVKIDPTRLIILLKPGSQSSATAANTVASNIQEDLSDQGIDSQINSTRRGMIVLDLMPQSSPESIASSVDMSEIANASQMSVSERAGYAALEIAEKVTEDNPDVDAVGPYINYTLPGPKQQSTTIQRQPQQSASATAQAQTVPTGVDRSDADLDPIRAGDGKNDIIADIAILDSGVNPHPDLNFVVDEQRSFLVNQINRDIAQSDPRDYCGHGTHVAGIAGAKDNDIGVVGTAPGARIYNFKILELLPDPNPQRNCSGDNEGIAAALQWVAANAGIIDVANLSITGFCPALSCNDPIYEAAVRQAVDAGVVVVVAAGNEGENAINYIPARFQDAITVSAIADNDGKCGAAGSNISFKDDSLATFSNFGPMIDIAAPGVDIISTSNDGKYIVYSGTSMAAPYVAGAAASYIAANRQMDPSPSDVRNALIGLGSTRQGGCDGNGRGYFTNDKDDFPEPLLYTANMNQIAAAAINQTGNITNTVTNTTSVNDTS